MNCSMGGKIMEIKIKKLTETATIPTSGTKYAAGYDLHADIEKGSETIPAHKTQKIGTGIAMEIPEGYVGLIFARSGLSTKRSLRPANCVGVIDSDYRGEICVALHNDGQEAQAIHDKDRIAQIAFVPHLSVTFKETDTLEESERGEGGFGSTGK